MITTNRQAAAWYRQAQRAAHLDAATLALHRAVDADPTFELALADLEAISRTLSNRPDRRQMNWERHHIEVVRTAATGNATRAADLLREHLAGVGCDPLAFRIVAQLQQPARSDDNFQDAQIPGCHAIPWPRPPSPP